MQVSVCVAAEVTAVMGPFPSSKMRCLSGRLGGDLDFRVTCFLDSLLVATSLVDFVLDDGIRIGPFRLQPVIEN